MPTFEGEFLHIHGHRPRKSRLLRFLRKNAAALSIFVSAIVSLCVSATGFYTAIYLFGMQGQAERQKNKIADLFQIDAQLAQIEPLIVSARQEFGFADELGDQAVDFSAKLIDAINGSITGMDQQNYWTDIDRSNKKSEDQSEAQQSAIIAEAWKVAGTNRSELRPSFVELLQVADVRADHSTMSFIYLMRRAKANVPGLGNPSTVAKEMVHITVNRLDSMLCRCEALHERFLAAVKNVDPGQARVTHYTRDQCATIMTRIHGEPPPPAELQSAMSLFGMSKTSLYLEP
jgi:hypothetical protein